MIYQPEPVFNIYAAIGEGIVLALVQAAGDFVSGSNKAWTYYLGVAFGGAAAATGIPGAAAILYVVGDSVDLLLFHSRDGSDVRLFLNGIEQAAVDTFLDQEVGEFTTHSIILVGGITNRIDIVNYASTNPSKTSPINWLAIGPVTVNGSGAYALPAREFMALQTVVFHIVDAETNSPMASCPINFESTVALADVQAAAVAIAPLLDAISGGIIDSADLTLPIDLSGASPALKSTAETGVTNERGGLITFDTSGPRADSVRIPAISFSKMSGNEFLLTDTDVAALVTYLTTDQTINTHTVRVKTSQDYNFVTARRGVKSRRK